MTPPAFMFLDFRYHLPLFAVWLQVLVSSKCLCKGNMSCRYLMLVMEGDGSMLILVLCMTCQCAWHHTLPAGKPSSVQGSTFFGLGCGLEQNTCHPGRERVVEIFLYCSTCLLCTVLRCCFQDGIFRDANTSPRLLGHWKWMAGDFAGDSERMLSNDLSS